MAFSHVRCVYGEEEMRVAASKKSTQKAKGLLTSYRAVVADSLRVRTDHS